MTPEFPFGDYRNRSLRRENRRDTTRATSQRRLCPNRNRRCERKSSKANSPAADVLCWRRNSLAEERSKFRPTSVTNILTELASKGVTTPKGALTSQRPRISPIALIHFSRCVSQV